MFGPFSIIFFFLVGLIQWGSCQFMNPLDPSTFQSAMIQSAAVVGGTTGIKSADMNVFRVMNCRAGFNPAGASDIQAAYFSCKPKFPKEEDSVVRIQKIIIQNI
jgi:hypothetical protein